MAFCQVILLFSLSVCGYVGKLEFQLIARCAVNSISSSLTFHIKHRLLTCLIVYSGALTGVAVFNQGGVIGTITFRRLENGSTQIDTSFLSGTFSGWHVHVYPADYTEDPAIRCENAGTGPHYDPNGRFAAAGSNYSMVCNENNPQMCEAGDLSGKFGPLQLGDYTFIDLDPLLQLNGRYGIIGRSVVIHAPVTSTRVACANIILQNDMPRIFVATFLGPVAGSIYFRQSDSESEVGTFIYAKLFYSDGTTVDTEGHQWSIHDSSLVRLLCVSHVSVVMKWWCILNWDFFHFYCVRPCVGLSCGVFCNFMFSFCLTVCLGCLNICCFDLTSCHCLYTGCATVQSRDVF